MVAQAPAATLDTDRKRLVLLCQLLAYYRDKNGTVDLAGALHHAHVESFVRYMVPTEKTGTYRACKSHLARFGRLLHPEEYPYSGRPRTGRGSSRRQVAEPHTAVEIQNLYRARWGLSVALADRLVTLLDLCTGVGARANEVVTLTGASVGTASANGREWVYVDLPSRRTGEIRRVPVLDSMKSARLLARSKSVGSDGVLIEGALKNRVNGVQTAIRKRGVDVELKADRLRNAWVLEVMQMGVPTAVLLRVADLGDSHTLYELSKFLPPLDVEATASWFEGATR